MRRKILAWAFSVGLIGIAFYSVRGDTEIPDLALKSIRLLKKPIEELLPDVQDEDTTVAVEQATLDLEPYQDLHNERESWNQMRRLIESGQPLEGPLPSEIAVSTSPVGRMAPAIPPPPGFTVQLPYESRLTVSGRKTIGMIFRSTQYSNPSYATTQGVPTGQNSFELQQSLQVRINGQIGRKVTVNVDFDDTKTDKKDISIVYKGDPDEIVQRAAFGDINLSLPQTEFAGYSKQVFGASAELKYKALKGYFIGSRTKGETETKEFVGNVILQRLNIPDISYIRHRFYNYRALTGGHNDVGIDITKLKVYINTQDSTRLNGNPPLYTSMTVDQSLIPNLPAGASTTSGPGLFLLMAQGVDYTVDPSSGVITFKNALTNVSIVAIDYTPVGASQPISATRGSNPGLIKAIKWDESQITQIPATEELTHYNLGATKIVRDNGQGNFTLLLKDLGNNNIGTTVGVQYLPNNAGQIYVDFEAGTFTLTRRLDNNVTTSPFAQVYFFTPTTQSSFFVEFSARVKTYTLRPNIVLNSEHITMDGRLLVRDVDYFIDYASGFITFFNEDLITDTTHIVATYDFSPFGIAGAQQDTLVGTRAELSLSPVAPILASSLIGSSVLYDFAPQATAAPDIRQTSGSFLVEEADLHLKDLIFNAIPTLKSSFTTEVARSVRNPNTFGKALIDNMEGIADETSVSLSKLNWQISANPSNTTNRTYLNAIGQVNLVNSVGDNLTNNLVRTLDVNPNAAALSGDQTQILTVNYNLSQSPEASIATVLSPGGVDFSKKLYLEMWVQGDGSFANGNATQTQINVTLGQISENFDGRVNPSVETEDTNHNNTLDTGEDVGIQFQNPNGSFSTLGAGNLRLDSNDLDRNGVLDGEDTSIGANYGYDAAALNGMNVTSNEDITFDSTVGPNRVDFSGWKIVRVPLNISSATASNFSAIKELRISLRPMSAGPTGGQGTINIAKIAVVGNKWQAETSAVIGSTITSSAINTEENANYVSPAGNADFDDLNQINTALTGPTPAKRKEQSLAIDYAFAATTAPVAVTAVNVTVSPMDFTAYGSLHFFVYKNGSLTSNNQGSILIFRAGTVTDYLEFDYPVDNLPPNAWTELTINQIGGSRPTGWASGTAGGSVPLPVGSPNLSSVAEMRFGVYNPTSGNTISGELWIDELHASDVITRVGYASLLKSDFELYGWGTFGAGAKNIDRNFETFTSAITNQDRHEQNAYLNLTRLSWFPMKFTGQQTHTITPPINTVASTLVSVQQQGDVQDRSFTSSGILQIPKVPKIGLTYDTDDTKTADLFRQDKTDNYGMTMDYAVPVQRAYLPRNVQLGYKLSKLKINFGDGALLNATDPFTVSDTQDDTQDINAKLSFQPLTGFTFNPSFARSTTRETKDVRFGDFDPVTQSTTVAASTETLTYDKLKSQTMGFDGTMAFKRWFSPRLRYSITNRETYGIPLSSDIDAALTKNVDRTDTGEAAWDFAWRDFSKKIRALQSLNVVSSYLMEDGDSWQNVDQGYSSLNTFSVRDPLKSGQITNSTIRDTFRSTQRLNPFDWATNWSGAATPLKTMSVTSTLTNTKQRQDTTGTDTIIHTLIIPDMIIGMTQTEYFFHAQKWMSNSQMNLKTQYKTVDTLNTSLEKSSSNGGDWRFTMFRKLDLFVTYTRTTDNIFDKINNVVTSDSQGSVLGAQLGFNIGKWRITPKYDQSIQQTTDSSGRLTVDTTSRTPALQVYADLFLPAGLKLPFGDLVVFSNRVRTTDTLSLQQQRSSLDELNTNTDTYKLTTTNDYEMTTNMRLTIGLSYFYTVNKVTSDANSYGYEFNSLLTIQF